MTWFDWAVIGVVALSGLLAFSRGFIREMLALAGWVVAGLVTYYTLPSLAPMALQVIDSPTVAPIAAGVIVFLLTLLVFGFISHYIATAVHANHAFGFLDRILGLGFGLVRGALLVSLAYLMLNHVFGKGTPPDWFAKAELGPSLKRGEQAIRSVTPENWLERIDKIVRQATGNRVRPLDPARPGDVKPDAPPRPEPRPER
jgi:membrane protein required for colicin V production